MKPYIRGRGFAISKNNMYCILDPRYTVMKDARKIIIMCRLLSQLFNSSSVDILSDIHKYIWADKIIIYMAAVIIVISI